jgi:hypothetical protein
MVYHHVSVMHILPNILTKIICLHGQQTGLIRAKLREKIVPPFAGIFVREYHAQAKGKQLNHTYSIIDWSSSPASSTLQLPYWLSPQASKVHVHATKCLFMLCICSDATHIFNMYSFKSGINQNSY